MNARNLFRLPGAVIASSALALNLTNTTSTYRDCVESPYPGKPPRCFTYTAGAAVSGVALTDALPATNNQQATPLSVY